MEQTEKQIVALIATDRLYVPISSMKGKLERQRKKLASEIKVPDEFAGHRVYARLQEEEGQKARGMTQGIYEFCRRHPQLGRELSGLIAEERVTAEPTLYFGMNKGCRLTSADYMQVMTGIGFSPARAEGMYDELAEASRRISRARLDEERSILVGEPRVARK